MSDPPVSLHAAQQKYWRTNVVIMSLLLAVWAFVGLGCGILWADWLNHYRLGGVPLGFWFAQQGSIATFVVIILIYAILMNRLDTRYHRQTQHLRPPSPPSPPSPSSSASAPLSPTPAPSEVSPEAADQANPSRADSARSAEGGEA